MCQMLCIPSFDRWLGGVGAPAVPPEPGLLSEPAFWREGAARGSDSEQEEGKLWQVVDHPFTKFGGRGKRRASGRVKVGFLDGASREIVSGNGRKVWESAAHVFWSGGHVLLEAALLCTKKYCISSRRLSSIPHLPWFPSRPFAALLFIIPGWRPADMDAEGQPWLCPPPS